MLIVYRVSNHKLPRRFSFSTTILDIVLLLTTSVDAKYGKSTKDQ